MCVCECVCVNASPFGGLSPPKSRRLSGGGCPEEERALPACLRMKALE